MKTNKLAMTVSRSFHKVGFGLKKHSPEILVAVGVVGTVASAVMACRATLKVHEIMGDAQENLDLIHDTASDEHVGEEYSAEDAKKDTAIVYAQTGLRLAKLYAPSVALGVFSIGCMVASNNILRKRNVALAAAYTAIDKSFKEYRSRVIERFGKEIDHELKYNIKAKKIEEVVKDEDGKEKKVKKTLNVVNPEGYSDYARFFDEGCDGWDENPQYSLMTLNAQQAYCNNLLQARGYLFLNEVYELLGIPKTEAGQVVGWRYDPHDETIDSYVSFGIYDAHRQANRDFVNGYEPVIILDFNVDGVIIDKKIMPKI